MSVFFLVHKDNHTYICNPAEKLNVQVFELACDDFVAPNGSLDLYGAFAHRLFAFITPYSFGVDTELVTEALKWYANHIDLPDMKFTAIDPRKAALNS